MTHNDTKEFTEYNDPVWGKTVTPVLSNPNKGKANISQEEIRTHYQDPEDGLWYPNKRAWTLSELETIYKAIVSIPKYNGQSTLHFLEYLESIDTKEECDCDCHRQGRGYNPLCCKSSPTDAGHAGRFYPAPKKECNHKCCCECHSNPDKKHKDDDWKACCLVYNTILHPHTQTTLPEIEFYESDFTKLGDYDDAYVLSRTGVESLVNLLNKLSRGESK